MTRPKIVLIIASSLDGRIAFPHGKESHLGSIEDKKMLNKALFQVDGTLFGSGTLKAHKSTFLLKENFSNRRKKISNFQPISIVASNSNNFSDNWLYFKQPITRWLISTNSEVINNNFSRTFIFNTSWQNTLTALWDEGIKILGLLGGTQLINSFAKEDLIDEIKITIIPKIIGGKYSWIPFKKNGQFSNFNERWEIKDLKTLKTNEIFVHYAKKNDI